MRKRLKKIAVALGVVAAVIGMEFGYFCYVLAGEDKRESADAVVVFAGASKRVEKGYELLKEEVGRKAGRFACGAENYRQVQQEIWHG